MGIGRVELICYICKKNKIKAPDGTPAGATYRCADPACTPTGNAEGAGPFDRCVNDPAFRYGLRRALHDDGLLSVVDPARERRQDAPEWASEIGFLKILCAAHSNGLLNIERRMAILYWRYALNWSLSDIAAALGMTIGSTKSMLRQLRKRGDSLWVNQKFREDRPASKKLRHLERVLEKAEPGKRLDRLRIINESQQYPELPRSTFPTWVTVEAALSGNKEAQEFLEAFNPRSLTKKTLEVFYSQNRYPKSRIDRGTRVA